MKILALLLALAWLPLARAQGDPAAVSAPDDGTPLMLRFPDGSLLWGSVQGHTPEHLEFRRLDNGGLVRVPWGRVDPEQADRLMRQYGYVDLSDDEVFVEADRLLVGDGEIVGKIISRDTDDFVVKTANSQIRVPKLRVSTPPTKVQVPALDVYTADELYTQELSKVQPETAADHVEMARFCERILEFDRAIEHYEAAGQLPDAGGLDIDLPAAAALAETKAGKKAELEHLRQIDSLRARRKYDEALSLCDQFAEQYDRSELLPEAAKKRKRIERARQEALSEEVVRSWHRWSGKIARNVARDRELDLAAVIAYVDEQMSEDIQERVLSDMRRRIGPSVEPDEVLNAWVQRDKGRWHKSSYGYGTWLLGEARALDGLTEDQDEVQASQIQLTDEQRALAERVKRYLENQKTQRALKSAGSESEERQTFWLEFPLNAKELWILAYYAEFSGDMTLRKPTARPCRECGGTGVREQIRSGPASTQTDSRRGSSRRSTSQKIACPTCHHIGIVRRVTYR